MQMHREPDTALRKACTVYTLWPYVYTPHKRSQQRNHTSHIGHPGSPQPGGLRSGRFSQEPPKTLRRLGRLLRLLQRPGRDPECLGKRRSLGFPFGKGSEKLRVHA